MSNEINRVIAAIKHAGGSIRSRELMHALQNDGLSKRDIQLAVQTAFDKGLVKLDREMRLIEVTDDFHAAA